MNKLNLKRFQNSTVAISFFWVAMIFLYIIGFVFLSFNAKAQGYKRVIVTESSLMDGMYWSIGNCDLDTTYMPKNYKVLMRDFDGNAWGGSVMIIVNYPELDSALTLDYYNATQNLIVHDCGCNDSTYFDQNLHPYDLSVREISNILFKPTIYYDMLGRVVTPTKGMYIASDGILRKKIYIDEIK